MVQGAAALSSGPGGAARNNPVRVSYCITRPLAFPGPAGHIPQQDLTLRSSFATKARRSSKRARLTSFARSSISGERQPYTLVGEGCRPDGRRHFAHSIVLTSRDYFLHFPAGSSDGDRLIPCTPSSQTRWCLPGSLGCPNNCCFSLQGPGR